MLSLGSRDRAIATAALCTVEHRLPESAHQSSSAERHQQVAVHQLGDKRLRWCLAGRLVGVGGVRVGSGLPLVADKGMASMFECPQGASCAAT